MGRSVEKCECGSTLFYACKCKDHDNGTYCVHCDKKIYIDYSRSKIYET